MLKVLKLIVFELVNMSQNIKTYFITTQSQQSKQKCICGFQVEKLHFIIKITLYS